MSEPVYVEITDPAHLAQMWRWMSLVDHANVLARVPEFHKVPGFGLASALLDKEIAEEKSTAVMMNMRAIAAAGIDVTKVAQIHIEGTKRGDLRLQVTMMDLADLAGGGAHG